MKLQHQVDTKMEVKQRLETCDPQPLEAVVNIIEVVETKDISQEYVNFKTREETIGMTECDEFK